MLFPVPNFRRRVFLRFFRWSVTFRSIRILRKNREQLPAAVERSKVHGYHSNKWKKNHPEAVQKTEETQPEAATATTTTPNHAVHMLLAGLALLAELGGIVYGIAALGYFAVLFLYWAFWDYTKQPLEHRTGLERWGVRVIALVVMAGGMYYCMGRIEQMEAAREGIVKLQFSITPGRTVILDNSLGKSNLADIHITGLEVKFDKDALINKHQAIATEKVPISSDLNYKPFIITAGEVKYISLLTYEYAILELNARPMPMPDPTEQMSHYYCLRFSFMNAGTGERLVHYMVISRYSGRGRMFAVGENPEAFTGVNGSEDSTGFPFNVGRAVKEQARIFWGTEFKEY